MPLCSQRGQVHSLWCYTIRASGAYFGLSLTMDTRLKQGVCIDLLKVLAVSSGCLNNCTYCKTKQARGDLVSYPPEELVEQAVRAFSEGCREIWLTSEDLGAWGRDFGMVRYFFVSFLSFCGKI